MSSDNQCGFGYGYCKNEGECCNTLGYCGIGEEYCNEENMYKFTDKTFNHATTKIHTRPNKQIIF